MFLNGKLSSTASQDKQESGAISYILISYLNRNINLKTTANFLCLLVTEQLLQNLDAVLRVAPIRIETGRFENIDAIQRLCHFCNVIEDEIHVMLECSAYNDLRDVLFAETFCSQRLFHCCQLLLILIFAKKKRKKKKIFLFSHTDMIRICAKTCFRILQTRNAYFYK